MLVHRTVTPVFCSLFSLLHSRFCFVTQRFSPSSSLEKKDVAWRHKNRLRRRVRIMTPVLTHTLGWRQIIPKKTPLHGVVRGRITHLSIWGFTCLPWHIPAAHTIADKNTGSHVMSCLSWENSRHFATPTLASSRNNLKNSTLVMSHYPDLGSASDWSCCNMFQPLRGTTKSWIVTRYQYGISTLASQTLFRGGRGGGGVGKPCWRREMSAVFAFLRI